MGSEMKNLGDAITNIYMNTEFNGTKVFGLQETTLDSGTFAENAGSATAATIAYGEDGTQSVNILAANTTEIADLFALTAAATGVTAGISNATLVTTGDVESAITEVNTTRATYGAQQNQLEHASNNLATTKENLQAAESRIRDVDMADEMMEYTKNNILIQAAQAMLAQANAQPQGVLQLLQ
jgi:flagellin